MQILIKIIIFCLISTSICFAVETMPSPATNDLAANINAIVQNTMTARNLPGYHLTVIQNGQVIFNQGFGYSNVANKQLVTNKTIFGLASITKTFTAIALLKLVEEKAINLDDPLSRYIQNLTPAFKNLTIRQLASMTAGIAQGIPSAANVKWPAQMQILIQQPLQTPPGQAYQYSNFSYRLLGQVIENVTGKTYLSYINETILSPLQMLHTGTINTLSEQNIASAYKRESANEVTPFQYRDPRVEFSAGMLFASGDDLIKYVQALLNHQILQASSYQTMWYNRQTLSNGKLSNWAFGWGSRVQADGKRVISMNGADPGIASFIIMVPSTKCAVIGLSNMRVPAAYNIARRVARLVCGVQRKQPVG